MTEELKTLKDFECVCYWCQEYEVDEHDKKTGHEAVDVEELRKEAIKWVKFYTPGDKLAPKSQVPEIHWINDWNVREFIKHFFNITEEELK